MAHYGLCSWPSIPEIHGARPEFEERELKGLIGLTIHIIFVNGACKHPSKYQDTLTHIIPNYAVNPSNLIIDFVKGPVYTEFCQRSYSLRARCPH